VTKSGDLPVTEGNNVSMMVIIVGAIVGLLLVVVLAMIVRVITNKRRMTQIPAAMMGEVKT